MKPGIVAVLLFAVPLSAFAAGAPVVNAEKEAHQQMIQKEYQEFEKSQAGKSPQDYAKAVRDFGIKKAKEEADFRAGMAKKRRDVLVQRMEANKLTDAAKKERLAEFDRRTEANEVFEKNLSEVDAASMDKIVNESSGKTLVQIKKEINNHNSEIRAKRKSYYEALNKVAKGKPKHDQKK